jgi:hypothetical protein
MRVPFTFGRVVNENITNVRGNGNMYHAQQPQVTLAVNTEMYPFFGDSWKKSFLNKTQALVEIDNKAPDGTAGSFFQPVCGQFLLVWLLF